jgi:hypothetical protein
MHERWLHLRAHRRVSASLQEEKAQGRIEPEREKEAPAGPQAGVEAQKLNVHIIRKSSLKWLPSCNLASEEISPTKINRADEVNRKQHVGPIDQR